MVKKERVKDLQGIGILIGLVYTGEKERGKEREGEREKEREKKKEKEKGL